MKEKQDKEDLRPKITTDDTDSTVPQVTGNETDKPITGGRPKAPPSEERTTRDDGDNDDGGPLR